MFSRGLEAASPGPACSLLGLFGDFSVKEHGRGGTSHTATRVTQPLPGQGRTRGGPEHCPFSAEILGWATEQDRVGREPAHSTRRK